MRLTFMVIKKQAISSSVGFVVSPDAGWTPALIGVEHGGIAPGNVAVR